jgi:hypothetical protein
MNPVDLREQCIYLAWQQGLNDNGDVSPALLFDLWAPLIRAEAIAEVREKCRAEALAQGCTR